MTGKKRASLAAGLTSLMMVCAYFVMGIVLAPAASAHTGTLKVTSACQADGTYRLTFSGQTNNVPASGPGHTATLTVGEIQPSGATVQGAPSKVVGNTNYGWTMTVPGATTYAQATAFLKWGDGAQSDPIGKINLGGDCGDNGNSKKITFCHATPADTAANGWNKLTTSVNAFYQSGHPQHAADIVPPFSYVKHGQTINYPGLNWDAEGQAIYNNGCSKPVTKITAPEPVVTPPSCTADGSVSWPAFEHGHWTNITGTGPGTQSATPVADNGYELTNPGQVTVTVQSKLNPNDNPNCRPDQPKQDHETRTQQTQPDCSSLTYQTWNEERSRSYVWDNGQGKWVPGAWSDWTEVSGSRVTKDVTNSQVCDLYIETSHTVGCATASVTLHNHSPWVYPVSVVVDGGTSTYGPVVNNLGAASNDQSGTKNWTFSEDSGTHTIKYRVDAGTESDLYNGLPVGEWTEFTVETDCEANPIPVEPAVATHDECGVANDTGPTFATENDYWTAEVTNPGQPGVADSGAVTFTAKDGWLFGNVVTKVVHFTPNSDKACPPTVVIQPDGYITGDCTGTGTAVLDNSASTTSVGFEVVLNGKATLYTVAAGKTRTVKFSGAKPHSKVRLQDSEANLLDELVVPAQCHKPPHHTPNTTPPSTTPPASGVPETGAAYVHTSETSGHLPYGWVAGFGLGGLLLIGGVGFARRRQPVKTGRHRL